MANSRPNNLRPIIVRPTDAARGNLSIGQQLGEVTSRIQQPGSIMTFFDNKDLKRLRADADALAAEQAAALVIHRTALAQETGLQAIDLEKKQQLAEVAHAQTATTAQLQQQAHAAGARAIRRSVEQEQSLKNEILSSRCTPEDKLLLAQFAKQLAIESIETIYKEQQTPFGRGNSGVPQYRVVTQNANPEPEFADSEEYHSDNVPADDSMT